MLYFQKRNSFQNERLSGPVETSWDNPEVEAATRKHFITNCKDKILITSKACSCIFDTVIREHDIDWYLNKTVNELF